MQRNSVPSKITMFACAALLVYGCAGAGNHADRTAVPSNQTPAEPTWLQKAQPNHLALARELIAKGHYDVARVQLEHATGSTAHQAEIFYLTGICHLESGDPSNAIVYFKKAMKHDPGYAPAHNGMGLAIARNNDFQGALLHFRRAMELDPAKANVCNNLGYALLKSNRPAEAETVLRKCLAIDPGFSAARNNLTVCLGLLNKDDQALALLLQTYPPAAAYRNMSAIFHLRGDVDSAARMAEKACAADRHDEKVR